MDQIHLNTIGINAVHFYLIAACILRTTPHKQPTEPTGTLRGPAKLRLYAMHHLLPLSRDASLKQLQC